MAKAKATKKAKTVSVDWSDEESVRAAMAVALKCNIDELFIEEDKGMSSFREGDIYRVEWGREEYMVAENDEVSRALAVAVVKQDLEESPENFDSNFIQSHIDLEHLRKELHSDVYDMRYEDLKDEAEKRPLKFMIAYDIDIPEPSAAQKKKYCEENDVVGLLGDDAEDMWGEIGEEPEVKDRDIEAVAEAETNSQLKDPVAYLSDIYSEEDALKKAVEIGGIDVNAAADEAVSTDGEGHFLSHYDGNMHDGPGGIVYWRVN